MCNLWKAFQYKQTEYYMLLCGLHKGAPKDLVALAGKEEAARQNEGDFEGV